MMAALGRGGRPACWQRAGARRWRGRPPAVPARNDSRARLDGAGAGERAAAVNPSMVPAQAALRTTVCGSHCCD